MTFRQRLQHLFFPLGSVQKIKRGYLKGYRIRLTENSLWSPLIGNWEPAMQKIMVNVIRPGDVVYDLGANNGLHGLLMAGLTGGTTIYNFEPFPDNIAEINENYGFNNITNYENVRAAVADRTGDQVFDLGQHHKQGSIVEESAASGNSIRVPVISLDDFIKNGKPGPNFIKMDIEGAEGAALNGFSENIDRFRPLMIIELHNPEQDKIVGNFLQQHQYTAYRFDTFAKLSFTRIKDFGKVHPDPDGIWGSLFCLPPGEAISNFSFEK